MREPRSLRRKKHRRALWNAQEGKCARCGEALPYRGWHADHVTPWRVRSITNLHEMKALCARCNQEKGAKMPDIAGMRAWQSEFVKAIREAKAKKRSRFMVIVTPAGGKASVPYLTKMFVDSDAPICWLAPRESLCDGGAEIPGWIVQYCAQHLIRRPVFRFSGNEQNPRHDTDGYIITYQSVVADVELHIQEFEAQARVGARYILVLDEMQFLADEDQKWGEAVHKLIERCSILIVMSGTLFRSDGRRLPILPYVANEDGDEVINENHPGWVTVVYTRRQALIDRTIIPIELIYRDARGEFVDHRGNRKAFDSLNDMKTRRDRRDALRVTLNDESARVILTRMLDNWQLARRRYAGRQALVLADRQTRAENYVAWIKEAYPSVRVGLAITREGPKSRETVKAFRHGKIDILVTVGVAHVGMDAVRVTHIALLTAIRARGWLEQAIARGVRVDPEAGPWRTQRCTVWTIDDPLLVAVMSRIEEEQAEALAKLDDIPEWKHRLQVASGEGGVDLGPALKNDPDWDDTVDPLIEAPSDGDDSNEPIPGEDSVAAPPSENNDDITANVRAFRPVVTIFSELTNSRSHELNMKQLDHEVSMHFERVAAQHDIATTPIEMYNLVNDALGLPPDETVRRVAVVIGVRDVEDKLRAAIQQKCSSIDEMKGLPYGTTNAYVKSKFKKSREVMTIAELQQVWAFVVRLWEEAAMASRA